MIVDLGVDDNSPNSVAVTGMSQGSRSWMRFRHIFEGLLGTRWEQKIPGLSFGITALEASTSSQPGLPSHLS